MKKFIACIIALLISTSCMYGMERAKDAAFPADACSRQAVLDSAYATHQEAQTTIATFKASHQGIFSRAVSSAAHASLALWNRIEFIAHKTKSLFARQPQTDEDVLDPQKPVNVDNVAYAKYKFNDQAAQVARARNEQIMRILASTSLTAVISAGIASCKFSLSGQSAKFAAGVTATASLLSWLYWGIKAGRKIANGREQRIKLLKDELITQQEALAGYAQAKGEGCGLYYANRPICGFRICYSIFGSPAMRNMYQEYKKSLPINPTPTIENNSGNLW